MVSNGGRVMDTDKYEALRGLALTLNQVSDLDVMLETILTEARRFVGAEAGSIYGLEDDKLIFTHSQNDFLARRDPNLNSLFKNREIPLASNTLAGYVARENVPLCIDDAYRIPPEKPYLFEPEFDRRTGYVTRSIMVLPLTDIRPKVLGVLQIINPLDEDGRPQAFAPEDLALMTLFSSTAAMALERGQIIRRMLLRTIKMAELRDPRETRFHAERVAAMAVMLYRHWARAKSLDPAEIKRNTDHLRLAAMLHDVGKVGISDLVLNKPGRLSAEERQEMEKHVVVGLQLFEPFAAGLDGLIYEVILNHHERWDGLGYPGWINPATGLPLPGRHGRDGRPLGKKGEEASIFGRVTAVADVFDALNSRRVYKDPFDEDLACQIMLQESGHHFDPELVDLLLTNLSEVKAIRNRFPE